MHVLLITQEPPLQRNRVATGNAVRTSQLEGALRNAGHDISQFWLSTAGSRGQNAFESRDELQAIITRQRPDAILVSYWELLELLPFEIPQPVIVDFVAPRPLEILYEAPENVRKDLARLHRNLSKCDLLLAGNEAQRDLLWFSLLQAGFDLRGAEPVLVVPLAAEPAGQPESDPAATGWTLVSGGVHWPWRQSGEYWRVIQQMKDRLPKDQLRLVLFGGRYRWQEEKVEKLARESEMDTDIGYETQQMAPYSSFSKFLLESAHIGLEIAQPNIERKYSQSFRSLEFLRHGLPLICSDYLPIARLVKAYDVGWTVGQPADLEPLLQSIMSDPEEWRNRSKNALRLVTEVLNPDITVKPLIDWLQLPAKAPRLPGPQTSPGPVVLGRPRLSKRLRRQYRLLKRVLLGKLFSARGKPGDGDNVLIVTRSDIFPADHGGAVKIVETARGLSRHHRKVGIVSDDRRRWWLFEDGEAKPQKLPFWLRFLSLPGSLSWLLHLSKDLPESNSFLYLPLTDNSFFWHCLYVGNRLKASILQAEFPAYAKPCIEAREILNAAVVLVEHNVEYARLKAQVAELSEAQYRNLRAIEIDLCNRSDAVVCVSDNDRQRLLNDGVKAELLNTIPHGFDPEPFALPAVESLREQFGLPGNAILIAFHGTFSYPPNRDALRVFAEVLLPQLAKSAFPFHVIAIGRNPPASSPHANIHFTGSVDEVGPWLKACDIAVIPLREGGGTRMKIIDCFAAGIPVISTAKGIEGIPVVNGREALITDDWISMTNDMIELAESKTRRQELASAASRFAAEMDWISLCKRYLSIYSAVRRPAK
jgi:glycosyltransferase involved in cell wall biosynthesis